MTTTKRRLRRAVLAPVAAGSMAIAVGPVDASVEETTTTSVGQPTPRQAPKTITITPRSGPLGTVITIGGTGCPGSVIVAVTRNGMEEEGAQVAIPDEGGTWSARQTIPRSWDPDATYALAASCYDQGRKLFSYPPQPFEVTRSSPRARPVPAQPTFTG